MKFKVGQNKIELFVSRNWTNR